MKRTSGRSAAVLANLVLTGLGQCVSVAGQLLVVPLFLVAWGERLYGDWLTLSAMTAYLTLTDMGMQTYVANRLTGYVVRAERDALAVTLHSTFLLYLAIAVVGLGVLLGIVFVLPWDAWFAGRSLNATTVQVMVVLLGSAAIIGVLGGFVGALYRVFGEPERGSGAAVLQRTASLAMTFSLLIARVPPTTMAAAQLVAAIAFLVVASCDVSRRHRDAVFSLRHADLRMALSLVVPSSYFAVAGVAGALTVQGTLLIASAMLGPAAVTVFATSRTLANSIRQIVGLINTVAWPEFTRMDAAGPSARLATAHRLLVKASSLLNIWIVASLWFTGASIHRMWTRGQTQFDQNLMRLLLVHALCMTPSWASAALLAATNRHRAMSALFLAQGIATVGLCLPLIKIAGLSGLGLALLLTDFPLFGLLIPLWSSRVVGERLGSFVVQIYLKMVPMFGGAWAAAWAVDALSLPPAWSVAAAIGATFFPVLASGLLWLSHDERELVTRIVLSRSRLARA